VICKEVCQTFAIVLWQLTHEGDNAVQALLNKIDVSLFVQLNFASDPARLTHESE